MTCGTPSPPFPTRSEIWLRFGEEWEACNGKVGT